MKRVTTLLTAAVLLVGGASTASAKDETEQFIDLMSRYLTLSDQVVDIAGRPEASIFLAVEGIYEVYEKKRDAKGAITHLSRILSDTQSQTVRNLVRFKLLDIYKETGEADLALEQLDLIIKENS